MIHVLQLVKRYSGNYPLLNEMVRLDPTRFRTVVCYLDGEPDGRNEIEHLAARTIYLGLRSGKLRWYNVTLLKRLRRILEDERIDIVNCQLHRTTPIGLEAALLARNRPAVISTLHGLGNSSGWNRRLQNRLMYPRLRRVVAISHAVRDDILAGNRWLDPGKVVTVQNGLDLERFLDSADCGALRRQLFPEIGARFWFGTAGRLSVVKNHALLLRAFRRVLERYPDCGLLLAGRGELEGALRRQAAELGIEERVHFLGFRADIPQVLQALDCFVFPSLREGLGLALVEAMACGLPVIASQVGGIPEVFSEEPMGTLVPPGDEEALAAAMTRMVETPPELRSAMGESARRRAVDRFRAERMRADYERLYEECFRERLSARTGD